MPNNAIICVDDERNVLDSLGKELSEGLEDDYLIELAENGEEALEIFDELSEEGYRIPVVIADYIMPGIKGDKLLKRIHERNSRVYKIMLTGQAEVEGIASAVNYANLYKIIMKPWDYENLIFTVKEAIKSFLKNELIEKQYFELKRNKELTETLKKYNFKFNKVIEEHKNLFNLTIPALLDLAITYERGYFLNHTRFVVLLSLRIADGLQLDNNVRSSIVVSAILLHLIMQKMPEKYIGVDPNNLKKSEAKEYFKIYNEQIDSLSSNESMNKHTLILAQIWEHYDGTGLPHRLTFGKLTKASQILNLAITYHNGVYRIPKESMTKLIEEGEVHQSPEMTAKRHAEALQKIFKNSSWYDMDIIDAFQRLVKSKASKELNPARALIKVYAKGDVIRTVKYSTEDYTYDKERKIVIPVEKLMEEERKKKGASKAESKRSLETNMRISDLKSGMILGSDLVTKYGRLVAPKDATLDIDIIEEIGRLKQSGLLSDSTEIKVFIPREA